MKSPTLQPTTIDEYISLFSPDVAKILERVRSTIRKAAPNAVEKISYQLPTFYLNGNLVHFGGFNNHIGFYPTSSGVARFAAELGSYKTSRGTVQFPLDRPLPYSLIARIVRFRVKENHDRSRAKLTKAS